MNDNLTLYRVIISGSTANLPAEGWWLSYADDYSGEMYTTMEAYNNYLLNCGADVTLDENDVLELSRIDYYLFDNGNAIDEMYLFGQTIYTIDGEKYMPSADYSWWTDIANMQNTVDRMFDELSWADQKEVQKIFNEHIDPSDENKAYSAYDLLLDYLEEKKALVADDEAE